MLLEFGLKNYFCFNEGTTISFELDKNCPDAISHGKGFTTVLGVKGANGSGKTNILKGLSFLGWFCPNSFQYKPDDSIAVLPFFDSKEQIELFAKFEIDHVTYIYELGVTETEVKRETIYRKHKKLTKILERTNNEIVHRTNDFARLDTINLRKNVSIISSAHQYEFNELDNIYKFFNNLLSNVAFDGLKDKVLDIKDISKHLHGNVTTLNFVNSLISKCDIGISNVKISTRKREDGANEYFPIFIHDHEGKKYPVSRFTESSGTKMLYTELPLYKAALDVGGILILDEFDRHLHPHILPILLNLFEDPTTNPKNAQLLFTTHDSEVLNYLGRYRTYLVNKEDNASYAYRLDEIPGDILRNDRPILPAYNEGKIGGTPKL